MTIISRHICSVKHMSVVITLDGLGPQGACPGFMICCRMPWILGYTHWIYSSSVSYLQWLGDVNQKVLLENGDPVPVLVLANKV